MRIVYSITLSTFTFKISKNQGLTNSLNEIADMNNVLGAKNLLPNNAVSQTDGGVTFIVNSDGSISTSGVSTISTGNKHSRLMVYSGSVSEILGKTVALTGCPANGGSETYDLHIVCYDSSDTQLIQKWDYGTGTTLTIPSNTAKILVYARCYYNVDVTGLTFYPMLRPASIQDNTYVPYSMTNRELSDNISNGYILIGTHRVRVTSNSTTTTYAGLINNLYSDSAAYINSLNSDAYYQLATARVPGSDIKYITNDIATNNSLSQLEQNLFMMIKIGATLFMYDIEVRNNASRVFKYNSDGTLTDVTNNVIGQERAIDFNFNLYRYNNN